MNNIQELWDEHIFKSPDVISKMEHQWPEMTDEFKRICIQQYELFCLKQYNYGPDNISIGTPLATDEDIKLSLTGLWFRLNDKGQRLKTLIIFGSKDVVKESVEDTYQDLSIYGIIAQLVMRGKWGK